MESRELFLKGEIKRLKQLLNESYECCSFYSVVGDEKKIEKDYKITF